jgi:hypothetical protein
MSSLKHRSLTELKQIEKSTVERIAWLNEQVEESDPTHPYVVKLTQKISGQTTRLNWVRIHLGRKENISHTDTIQ